MAYDDARVDTQELREYARKLRADARDLEDVAAGMRSAVVSMTFGGPAADRFERATGSRIRGIRELSERLADVARVVVDEAEEIDRVRRRAAE